MSEVAPGIHRIESVLGPRPFSQYFLSGERSLLVDTGTVETAPEVVLPFLDGRTPDFVLITHADVDHFGGNAAVREAAPRALFCAHERDVPWIEDRERILRERYGWYAAHGPAVAYDEETAAWLRDAMGPDVPVDVRLTGGETLRLGDGLSVTVLHLPGHSPGHVGLWEPRSRTAIVTDAVLGRGLLDMDGSVVHPPPYGDPVGYEASARLLQRLEPRLLLTAHYEPMEGDDVRRFLDDTLAFVERARSYVAGALEAAGSVTLAELLDRAVPDLGPFSFMANELAGPLRAHLRELVAAGRAVESPDGLRWSRAG